MTMQSKQLEQKIESFLSRKFQEFPDLEESDVPVHTFASFKPHQLGS